MAGEHDSGATRAVLLEGQLHDPGGVSRRGGARDRGGAARRTGATEVTIAAASSTAKSGCRRRRIPKRTPPPPRGSSPCLAAGGPAAHGRRRPRLPAPCASYPQDMSRPTLVEPETNDALSTVHVLPSHRFEAVARPRVLRLSAPCKWGEPGERSQGASLSARAVRWDPVWHEPTRASLPPDGSPSPAHPDHCRVRVTSATVKSRPSDGCAHRGFASPGGQPSPAVGGREGEVIAWRGVVFDVKLDGLGTHYFKPEELERVRD